MPSPDQMGSPFAAARAMPLTDGYGGKINAQDELPIHALGDDYAVEGSGIVNRLPSMPSGITVFLRIIAAPTFKNSARLICQNGVDYVAAAGDLAIARSDGDGVWRLYVLPASGSVRAVRVRKYTRVPGSGITITIASPAVVSWTGSNFSAGDAVSFTTTGALPTGLSINTPYYVIASGLGANSFQLSATPGGSAINTTGSQSGTHTGKEEYIPNANLLYADIETIAGGGGGGSASGAVGGTYAGGGGASGRYSRIFATAATIGASKTVTIGTAGLGGASGSNNGGTGVDTSVGAICVAKGGLGGLFGSNAQVGSGGSVGAAGTGDVVGSGTGGGAGIYTTTTTVFLPAGSGGSSVLGGGATAPGFSSGTAVTGANATGFGSGGSGAIASNIASNAAGGDGSAGLVRITEYCSQ